MGNAVERVEDVKLQDLISGRKPTYARVVVDGHIIGYIGDSPGRAPYISYSQDSYIVSTGRTSIRASTLIEALRLLIHINSSLKGHDIASRIINFSRPLSKKLYLRRCDGLCRHSTLALALYTLLIHSSTMESRGILRDLANSHTVTGNQQLDSALSVIRLLDRAMNGASTKISKFLEELRRSVPARVLRLQGYLYDLLDRGPPYPFRLITFMTLTPDVKCISISRNPGWLTPLLESIYGGGMIQVSVRDVMGSMASTILYEELMPQARYTYRECGTPNVIIDDRRSIINSIIEGRIDPWLNYKIIMAGNNIGLVRHDENIVYKYNYMPKTTFRALIQIQHTRPCKPGNNVSLTDIIKARNPCNP